MLGIRIFVKCQPSKWDIDKNESAKEITNMRIWFMQKSINFTLVLWQRQLEKWYPRKVWKNYKSAGRKKNLDGSPIENDLDIEESNGRLTGVKMQINNNNSYVPKYINNSTFILNKKYFCNVKSNWRHIKDLEKSVLVTHKRETLKDFFQSLSDYKTFLSGDPLSELASL